VNRRGFLKAASAATVAAPMAADSLVMRAAKQQAGGLVGTGLGYAYGGGNPGVPMDMGNFYADKVARVRKLLGMGLPDWLKRQHRRDAEHTWLQNAPHVLVLRSVSDIARREMGIAYTERKLVADMEERPLLEQAREKFCKEFGWDW
jgi:hypothetical protein